tara:strand:- start:1862 stop:3577 length:1716 start_codon:yes stop_codon:yes gene_type:complete
MCGIAGIYYENQNRSISHDINKILKKIKHRGPDGKGFFVDRNKIALGNTRLSIQDISRNGNQPIYSACKRYVIVFNGEIYNFKELKKKLKEYKFQTNTDTEVLLYLFIKFGFECLKFLKGFFAFAIWDKKKERLYCARDKFGVKPFYYTKENSKFIFCSEIKPILDLKDTNIPNLNAINSYLTSEYYENVEKTFFDKIQKLKPGHCLTFYNNKILINKYWNFEDSLSKTKIPKQKKEIGELIYKKIDNAIKLSLVSDAKVSIAASGGLDSSILFYHVKKNYKNIRSLISFKFQEKKYSEEKYVKYALKKFGYNSKFSSINKKDFFTSINRSVRIQEEPFSGLPVMSYEKCFYENQNYKVFLDGSGLDEAHCGYDKYKFSNKNLNKISQDGSFIGDIISTDLEKNSSNYDHQLKKLFKDPLKNSMYQDLFYIKLPRALRFRDKISMAHSCELRPSFLDDELILTLFKLNNKFHINNEYGKLLLRKHYLKYIGKKIALRKKQQVQTPQREWFREDKYNYLKKMINSKNNIWETNWIDKKKFLNLLNLMNKGKYNNSFFIWKVINLDIWYKKFF